MRVDHEASGSDGVTGLQDGRATSVPSGIDRTASPARRRRSSAWLRAQLLGMREAIALDPRPPTRHDIDWWLEATLEGREWRGGR